METINNNTPVSFLTVGQLREVVASAVGRLSDEGSAPLKTNNSEEYVYGMLGLRRLFNCSHTTAWRLKKDVLKPAIIQHGRMFMINKETALKLVSEANQKGSRNEN